MSDGGGYQSTSALAITVDKSDFRNVQVLMVTGPITRLGLRRAVNQMPETPHFWLVSRVVANTSWSTVVSCTLAKGAVRVAICPSVTQYNRLSIQGQCGASIYGAPKETLFSVFMK
jgi:hypothetical protein